MLNQSLINPIFGMVVIVSCLLGITFLQHPKLESLTPKTGISKAQAQREANQSKTQLSLLQKLPSLGFDNLIADWAYLSFLQYFGDGPARQKTGYALVPDYFETIVNRDPRFIKAYLYLSPATSLYAGRPDRTVALMNQGLKSLSPTEQPRSYLVWLYKATDELLFLGDSQAAKNSYEMAAKWASVSTDPDSQRLAKSARRTAKFLAQNPDSKQAQVSAWLMVLSNAVDDATRRLAIQQIQKLGGEVSIDSQGEVKVQLPQD